MFKILFLLVNLTLICFVSSLENGLARTPPMGWLSWERFACQTDCDRYPNDCVNEQLYRDMADRFVSDGYKNAGYEYIIIDDCWMERNRDPVTHKLVADRKRFPSGIKALSDYVHSKGLKFGIYGDIGTMTCARYPGSAATFGGTEYFELDVELYAEYEADYLKLDGCFAPHDSLDDLYPKFGQVLKNASRPMVYSCSWPAYQIGNNPNYESIAEHCNVWRNYDDIVDAWPNVTAIIDYYHSYQDLYGKYHGPGAWFDPDMLIIGNFGLSLEQSKSQMAMWSLFAAPLLMSNDLRKVHNDMKAILLNEDLIAVNQDKLGLMATRVFWRNETAGPQFGTVEAWSKPLESTNGVLRSFAVGYFNRRLLGGPIYFAIPLEKLVLEKIANEYVYQVFDLFDGGQLIQTLKPGEALDLLVNPAGGCRMVKLVPQLATEARNRIVAT